MSIWAKKNKLPKIHVIICLPVTFFSWLIHPIQLGSLWFSNRCVKHVCIMQSRSKQTLTSNQTNQEQTECPTLINRVWQWSILSLQTTSKQVKFSCFCCYLDFRTSFAEMILEPVSSNTGVVEIVAPRSYESSLCSIGSHLYTQHWTSRLLRVK